jgi:hypothetical protein
VGAIARSLAVLAALLVVLASAQPARGSEPGLQPGIWISQEELQALPEHGTAWTALRRIADEPMGHADLADQNSDHDVHVLATALVAARTGSDRLRRKAAAGIMDAIGTERGGRTLALARGLVAYVVAADVIDLRSYRPEQDAVFRRWLERVRNEHLQPDGFPTLVATHERRPNNWGTHAGASRAAVDVYLGDQRDLARAAAVFKGFLGDRRIYDGFDYGHDRSWQADPGAPVGVNPPGAVRDGEPVGGALPDDMRRGCSLRFPPCPTQYPWEAMQGAVTQAEILSRQGYDAWNWGDQALRRAATFLFDLRRRYGPQWDPPSGGWWIPWLLNARYGTSFPVRSGAPPGKGMAYTDWTTLGPRTCEGAACSAPRPPLRQVSPIAAAPTTKPAGGGGERVPSPALVALIAVAGAAVLVALAAVLRRVIRRRRSSRSRR